MNSILRNLVILIPFFVIATAGIPKEKNTSTVKQVSLVPKTPGNAPDYFCTWNIQGYVLSHLTDLRSAMNQNNIFGSGKYENWVGLFPKIRKDIYFVMDDAWDIPQNVKSKNSEYYGTAELDTSRFPGYKGLPVERLKKLVTAIKARGWKGAGGWICAQEAPVYGKVDPKAYWIERLKAANVSGLSYWKVDWGKQSKNGEWRKMVTDLGRKYAPNLIIEHAMEKKFIEFSDVYRTYDVENINSLPVTIQRVVDLLSFKAQGDALGIINCEDEPYLAAGLGCAIGIMRHPFNGKFPNGAPDHVFPAVGRDLKSRMDEITRGVRWHRIAGPFGVGSVPYEVDSVKLKDYWIMGEHESWVKRHVGDTVTATTPARVSRGLPLPQISNLYSVDQPVVLASRYPNGAVTVVTIGRSLGRKYSLKRETVTVKIPELTVPVGVFGDYKELILEFPAKINLKGIKIYGQDLAGEIPVNITNQLKIAGNKLILPGELIRKIGLMAATKGDLSDPGMVLKIIH
ncbi:MAG: hypothetical protein Q8904_16390 [Bacteroidota bacterium]|nr:hypothetical protein [Bacteroidota bacterium]